MVDERTTTDFTMRLFVTLSEANRERCVLVREEDGQKAFYKFRLK